MKSIQILFLFTLGLFSNPIVWASAPVVDESENFANNNYQSADLQPLAHDDTQTSYFGDTQNSSTVNNPNESAKLLNKIEDLQQTIQELRGQLDTQRHAIDALKDQQLTLYKDLDTRISSLQGSKTEPQSQIKQQDDKKLSSAVQNSKPVVANKTSNNPADEQISYMAAYNLVEKKQYSKAQLALQEFIQNYPSSGYTPNAEYWLGELFLQEKDYSRALAHFENVVNNFPSSNKSAASMYKLGVTLTANGQTSEAKARFNEVMQKYPDSDAAQLAANQLKVL
jgi:tol-pal system protein YbgF